MYSGKQKLAPGTPVRVEENAVIVGQVEDNPYWYEIEYPSGQRDTVSIARITSYSDEPRALLDPCGDITILQPRLSAAGAVNLYHWLRTNLPDLAPLVNVGSGEDSELSANV